MAVTADHKAVVASKRAAAPAAAAPGPPTPWGIGDATWPIPEHGIQEFFNMFSTQEKSLKFLTDSGLVVTADELTPFRAADAIRIVLTFAIALIAHAFYFRDSVSVNAGFTCVVKMIFKRKTLDVRAARRCPQQWKSK